MNDTESGLLKQQSSKDKDTAVILLLPQVVAHYKSCN